MAVVDLPYGFDLADWDHVGWDSEKFRQMLRAVSICSTNKTMCFISFCAAEQYHHFVEAAQACEWSKPRFNVLHKTNKKSEGARRITQTCEFFGQIWRTSAHRGIWNFTENTTEKTDFYETPQIGSGGYASTELALSVVNPCQKPQTVLQRIVKNFTTPGATVLDLCAGSHSLLFACLEQGRSCVSIEKDPLQHEAAVKRIRTVLQEMAVKEKKRFLEEKNKETISDFPKELENPESNAPEEPVAGSEDSELTQACDPFGNLRSESIGLSLIGNLDFLAEGGHEPEAQEAEAEEVEPSAEM